MISKEYKFNLKKHIIEEFLEANGRVPNETELLTLTRKKEEEYSEIDLVGFSNFDLNIPRYREISSANKENKNRKTILEDMIVVNNKLNNLTEVLENSFKGFKNSVSQIDKSFESLENRLNNLLLVSNRDNPFVNVIEENFLNCEHVDFENTDAEIISGYCSLKRNGNSLISLENASITHSIVSNNEVSIGSIRGSLETLKQNNGAVWETAIYSKENTGRVSLVIDIDLVNQQYVGDLQLDLNPISVNKKLLLSVAYSVTGNSYNFLSDSEIHLNKEKFVTSIGVDRVRNLRLIFSKDAADTKTAGNHQNVYLFSLEKISLYSDGYRINTPQTVVCGPYTVKDTYGGTVNYTKVSLSACTIEPRGTSISFSVSNDGETWYFIDPKKDSSNLVVFGNNESAINKHLIDSTISDKLLVNKEVALLTLDRQHEAILNTAIDLDISNTNRFSFDIRRGTDWEFDKSRNVYNLFIRVLQEEGRWIDLGETEAVINGFSKQGKVFLPKGWHHIETNSKNWKELPVDINSEDALKKADSLYPYNHKYLFKGYDYSFGFTGDRVYNAFEDYCTYKMQYISPEKFSILDSSVKMNHMYYTIEYVDSLLCVKVLVDKTKETWNQEEFYFDWTNNSELSHEVYVKAVLETTDSTKTPMIEDFMIRTI